MQPGTFYQRKATNTDLYLHHGATVEIDFTAGEHGKYYLRSKTAIMDDGDYNITCGEEINGLDGFEAKVSGMADLFGDGVLKVLETRQRLSPLPGLQCIALRALLSDCNF